jgi:hypothetical protein
MARWLSFFLIASLTWASATRVEIRDNEVWLLGNGQPKQLTRDGKVKLQAVLSVPRDRVAYYEQCIQGDSCTPSVVIMDLEGRHLQVFQPRPIALGQAEPCASILNISWVWADTRIGVECHGNPSVSEYIEIDLPTEKMIQNLLGYGFTPSPDGKQIAHVGPIVHFTPPYAQSNYLLMNNTTVYPLPRGAKPTVEQPSSPSFDVVQEKGPKHIGIHDFVPRFTWSPDSKRVAFIDCVFDWVETGAIDPGGSPIGTERNRHCSVAVVSPSGTFTVFPLRDVPLSSLYESHIAWIDTERIQISFSVTKTFKVP